MIQFQNMAVMLVPLSREDYKSMRVGVVFFSMTWMVQLFEKVLWKHRYTCTWW